jgi:hypothetical protein
MSYRHVALAAALVCLGCGPSVAADKPSEAEVKQLIMKIDHNKPEYFVFHAIQMAALRKASNGEASLGGLPPNATVIVTKAEYTEDEGDGWVRDHTQFYYVFKDDFGAWSIQMTSMSGNYTSQLHKK